jgi:hypothetical protein
MPRVPPVTTATLPDKNLPINRSYASGAVSASDSVVKIRLENIEWRGCAGRHLYADT